MKTSKPEESETNKSKKKTWQCFNMQSSSDHSWFITMGATLLFHTLLKWDELLWYDKNGCFWNINTCCVRKERWNYVNMHTAPRRGIKKKNWSGATSFEWSLHEGRFFQGYWIYLTFLNKVVAQSKRSSAKKIVAVQTGEQHIWLLPSCVILSPLLKTVPVTFLDHCHIAVNT